LKCTSGCPADLDNKINAMRLEVPFVNTYFDFDDYNDPVKTYIDGRLTFDGLAKNIKTNSVFMRVSSFLYRFF